MSIVCPNKRMVTLAKFQASFENKMEVDEEEEKEVYLNETLEEIIEGPDERKLLAVGRTLSGLATQEGNEQREAIFRTRRTIGGKVCSLIIDWGSCTNVAFKIVVDKLKLTASPHSSPYTTQWLNKGKGIHVSSRCLVSSSIGKGLGIKGSNIRISRPAGVSLWP